MGRLEDVVRRHAEQKQITGRRIVIASVFLITVLTLVLLQCTNLGMPKPLPPKNRPPATEVDHVLLRPERAPLDRSTGVKSK